MTIVQGIIDKIKPYTRGAVDRPVVNKKTGVPVMKNGRAITKTVLTKQGVQYKASQARLAEHLFFAWTEANSPKTHHRAWSRFMLHQASRKKSANMFEGLLPATRLSLIQQPYRFGLAVCAPPVKSGPNKGKLPTNRGDYDNYVKAFLDAAQNCFLVPEDSLRWYRGPCDARAVEGGNIESGVYASTDWWFIWRFELADDCWMASPVE